MNMPVTRPKRISIKSGVYKFSRGKTPIYIGKAANLKKRLSSYFRKNVGGKTAEIFREATKLNWIETDSEVEALIKETELIKKYHPKYNYLMRDDKNYFYVAVTNENFPKLFITHQPHGMRIKNQELRIKERKNHNSKFIIHNSNFIGPFTEGASLKTTLRLLRKTFPYCTCKKPHKRSCLNAEIGKCPGYCCAMHDSRNTTHGKEYRENIKNLVGVLTGKKKKLTVELRRKMNEAAKGRNFEKAAKLRNQIFGLENIFRHRQLLEVRLHVGSRTSKMLAWQKTGEYIRRLLGIKTSISRVEGYDISNISGTEATGSMVVFIDGITAKSEYRKFKIRTVHQPSDVDMLKEVIRRRLAHTEWHYPDLMLIDGGRSQLNAALSVVKPIIHNSKFIIHVVALAKREEELYTENRKRPINPHTFSFGIESSEKNGDRSTPRQNHRILQKGVGIKLSTLPQKTAFFFQRVRDESHRFAKKYHHKLREIAYRE